MSLWSLLVCATVLWSGRKLLGPVVGADGSAQGRSLPTCVTEVGGRCERVEEGCPAQLDETSDECLIPDPIQERIRGCSDGCVWQNFCNGIQPEASANDWPVVLTHTVHQYEQFNITASWLNLDGWSFKMMLRSTESLYCVCGQTNPSSSHTLTGYYNDGGPNKTLHICLSDTSGPVRHLKKQVYTGSDCLDYARHHRLDVSRCRYPLDLIPSVGDLTVSPLGPSALQVSWTPSLLLRKEVDNIVYYVTVKSDAQSGSSSLETHNFTVSNSTSLTVHSLNPGSNYSISVRTWVQCASGSCQQITHSDVVMPTMAPPTAPPTFSTSTSKETIFTTLSTVFSTSDETHPTTSAVVLSTSYIVIGVLLALLFLLTSAVVVFISMKSRRRRSSKYKISNVVEAPSCPEPSGGISNSASVETNSTPHLDTHSLTSSQLDSDKLSIDIEVPHTAGNRLATRVSSWSGPPHVHILIIGSLRIRADDHIYSVANPLLAYLDRERTKIDMYDVAFVNQNYEEEGQRQRQSPSQWAGQALEWAGVVVCICNKEFAEDWNGDRRQACYEASLVRRVEHFVSGRLNHGQNKEVAQKFIAVVSERKDLRYVPAELEDCSYFVLDCEEGFERLARYLMGMAEVELLMSSRSVNDFCPV